MGGCNNLDCLGKSGHTVTSGTEHLTSLGSGRFFQESKVLAENLNKTQQVKREGGENILEGRQ